MIVTISGRPGSGKSAVGTRLAERLGYDHHSAGDFMRAMAAERGMSILELSRLAEAGDAIDREIDGRTRMLGDTADDFVIDARLAWFVLPGALKVFLDVTIEVAAERIFGAQRGSETENSDLASTRRAIMERTDSESLRYERYYGVSYLDPDHFDLVVDTSHRTVDEVVDLIADFVLRTDEPTGPPTGT